MAKLRAEYRSTKNYAPITLRFTFQNNGKPKRFDAKSNIYVEKDYWNNKHSSNSRDAEVRNKQMEINNKIQEVEKYVLKEFSLIPESQITKDWYVDLINEYYNPKEIKDLNEKVSYWIQHKIDNAHLISNSKGGYGLSDSRISKTKSLLKLFTLSQTKNIKVKDFNKLKFEEFRVWMIDTKKYSDAYAVKMTNDLASVFRYAQNYGIQVSNDFGSVKYKEVNPIDDDMDVTYLSLEEIEKIQELKLVNEDLINARKWLTILCYTGQRGGGFTKRLNKKMFEKVKNGYVIQYTQNKGNKPTTIPVLPPVKELYLKNELPYPMTPQKLNKLFPKLGKLAEINEIVIGKMEETVVIDKVKVRRRVKKSRPKYEYIKTHIGRKSFATNHYGKLSNESIMLVTNHSKLSTFLRYINKSTNTHVKSFLDYYNDNNQEEKSHLRVIEKTN